MTEAATTLVPVVGIGASAGGIEAFRGFFETMPPDSGLAFVVVLHLPADRRSTLPDILRRWTSMRIEEASDGCGVEANVVYVPPPGSVVMLADGRLFISKLPPEETREPNAITTFFNSLAASLREDAIGVVLSGTGHDGALGLKAIKEEGGLTLAQGTNGTAPQHHGMPASAIATGAVDIVASVESMPGHILSMRERRKTEIDATPDNAGQIDALRLRICAILTREIGHDFSGYKTRTFMRRVQRRMQVLGITALDAFAQRLGEDRGEVVMLFRDLLIGVTSFFRDEATFDVLMRLVIPRLFQGVAADCPIRVWVPGCATGEEAYSLAVLLREYADELDGVVPKIQVFATDIDEVSIATARAGRYPSMLLRGMAPERLRRFFIEGVDGSYTVAKRVRELCTFSTHSLTRDPPFSRIDLVSCRNLLIYLGIDLQGVVIPAFHYSLVPGGILLLGSAETINRHEALFAPLDRTHRIFQKRDVPTPPLDWRAGPGPREAPAANQARLAGRGVVRGRDAQGGNWAGARVLERFAPPFVVVNADGRSLEYSSRLTQFLELPAGAPSHDLLAMVRSGLRAPLRNALKQAVETGRLAEKTCVLIGGTDAASRRVVVSVEPHRAQDAEPVYLVVFQDMGSIGESAPPAMGEVDADRHLETELRDAREQLQSIVEEHDTALEELKSANEELHSVNEELQSTNEELETSKEEIQSINEELHTVNAQLASKVDELDQKNSDLRNLFDSTQVATIFLDPYMIVRNFTPAIANIYNLIPSDTGRPLTDIVSRLNYPGLREDCRHVLRSREPLERRVVADDGATHYLMRILPCRTPSSVVDGTIITFINVTSVVRAEQQQRLLVDELNHRVKNMLTVVITMATHMLRRAVSIEAFSHDYVSRLHALSDAYTLLSDQGWQSVTINDLLAEELKPFQATEGRNIVIDGPRVSLQPQAALAFGLAIHELATNAVKYGALSVIEGRIEVTWRVRQTDTGSQIELTWVEMGGPPVSEPTQKGFGMTLIERGLRQDMCADVTIEFAREGVRATVIAPLSSTAA